ncbi:hypothetical protein [uncultured Parvibaculum sp.]|uniref:hypothetical protein n=1 Tax=uncultured Parvibaculum sp. TaxID=291828 RepID=UPI0030DAC517
MPVAKRKEGQREMETHHIPVVFFNTSESVPVEGDRFRVVAIGRPGFAEDGSFGGGSAAEESVLLSSSA